MWVNISWEISYSNVALTCVSGICRVEKRFRNESSRLSGGFFCIADDICTVVRSFIQRWFDRVLHEDIDV